MGWLENQVSAPVEAFYQELGVDVTRGGDEASVRCFLPSHDDTKPSMSISRLTGLWQCFGCGSKGNGYQAAVALGRSERDAADLAKRFGLFLEVEQQEKPRLPNERDIRKWRNELWSNPKIIKRLGLVKGWSPYAIQRLGLGWDGERVVFPVRARVGSKLQRVGVVRYVPKGSPKSVTDPGSKRALWPCPWVVARTTKQPVFLVEGEPDAVALWSVGLLGIAVPGAQSWRTDWASNFWGKDVVVVADCDEPGRRLAARVKRDLGQAVVLDLDSKRDDGFDIGDLVAETRADPAALLNVRDLLLSMAAVKLPDLAVAA